MSIGYETAQNIIKGLEILCEALGEEKMDVCAMHDVLCAGPDSFDDVLPEAVEKLEKLKWSWNDEYQSWAIYV